MSLDQDLRYAVRTLRNSPGFTLVAVLTLALGIGATASMFSIVNGVLLAPLRFADADRIVAVNTGTRSTGFRGTRLAGGDIPDLQKNGPFEAFSFYWGGELGVQLRDRAEFTGTYFVDPSFFRVFSMPPLAGRLLNADDAGRSAIVSADFARRNFGAPAAAVGRTLSVEGRTYDVAGVLPSSFNFPAKSDLWIAMSPTPANLNRTAFNYRGVAKLRAGMPADAANSALDALSRQLGAAYPASNADRRFFAVPLRDQLVRSVRSTLLFLMASVALLLLIACANVANLMLARATGRAREMAVRAALGASRGRIVSQLLAESALLGLAAGAVGVLIATAGTRLALRLVVSRIALPRLNEIHVDAGVLAFAIALSILAALLFGLAPAWQASRVNLNDALKAGARGMSGERSPRLRNSLIVAQIAISFVLAIGAGLLFRTMMSLADVPLGYRTENRLVMYAHAPAATLDDHLRAGRLIERVVDDLRTLPGATSVAAVMGLPGGQYGSNGNYAIDGQNPFAPGVNLSKLPAAIFSLSSPGYFSTMGIPLVRGRDFSASDQYDSPFVAIVSEALARQSFPNQDPIGHQILCGLDSPKWMTVVGVVGDIRQDSPASAPGPALYMPLTQHPYHGNEVEIVVSTGGSPSALIAPVRQRVQSLNPEVAMKFTTLEETVADSVATPRFRASLAGIFAALALLLAMAGMYAVMNYTTAQRRAEFGIRMALGATPGNVVRFVIGKALRLAAIGVAVGLLLGIAASRVLAGMLFGLKPTDAATYAAVLLCLTPAVAIAAAVPAWRASQLDPLAALRQE